MIAVYKYPLGIADLVTISMPEGAEILHVECQDGQPFLWARVDTGRLPKFYRFRIYGTGHPMDRGDLSVSDAILLEHVATFQQGIYVWHLFRDPKPEANPS